MHQKSISAGAGPRSIQRFPNPLAGCWNERDMLLSEGRDTGKERRGQRGEGRIG